MYNALSTLNNTTEVSLIKALNLELCSVCTLDGINTEHKFQASVTILGRMSLSHEW